MSQCDCRSDDNERPVSGLRVDQALPAPEPSPGDYGLVEMPGAPAHIEAMLLGWRFSHAVIYVGDGHLVEAWFDRVPERDVTQYRVRDTSWFGVRWAPDGSHVMQSRRDRVGDCALRCAVGLDGCGYGRGGQGHLDDAGELVAGWSWRGGWAPSG